MGKTPSNEPVSLTIQQVADELQVHTATVRRMISRGELRAYRYGTSQVIRVDRADLNKLRRPVTTLADYRDAKAQYSGGAA
jgi:excisionase family DNA binding protein